MLRIKWIPTVLAILMALGSTGVMIATANDKKSRQELAAVVGAKTSLIQAINAAEQQTGGRAMKVKMEREKGADLYEVKTILQDQVVDIFVDPASGKVVRTDEAGRIKRFFDRDDQAEAEQLKSASITLASAITAAEQATDGKAVEVEFEHEDGKMLFEVKIAKDSSAQKVMVDSATGKVIERSISEAGEHKHN